MTSAPARRMSNPVTGPGSELEPVRFGARDEPGGTDAGPSSDALAAAGARLVERQALVGFSAASGSVPRAAAPASARSVGAARRAAGARGPAAAGDGRRPASRRAAAGPPSCRAPRPLELGAADDVAQSEYSSSCPSRAR